MLITTEHWVSLPLVIAGHVTSFVAEDVHIEADIEYRSGGVAFFDRRSESWVPPEPAEIAIKALRVKAADGTFGDIPDGPDFKRIAAALDEDEIVSKADRALADAAWSAKGRAA